MRIILFTLLCLISFLNKSFAWNIKSLDLDKEFTSNLSLNLVFCPLNYSNNEDSLRDIEALLERLRTTNPFNEFIDTIRAWQVNLLPDEEKTLFKETQGFPPLKVRQDFLDDISAQFKSDYKTIIIDAKGVISCAELSSIDKLSLIILGRARYSSSNSFAKGFLHELGHSFGLRDECADCAQLSPAGEPNCAASKEEAVKWWGDLAGKSDRVDYISGCCGNRNYIRPTIASLMNDPDKAEDFGPVNERFLRRELSDSNIK